MLQEFARPDRADLGITTQSYYACGCDLCFVFLSFRWTRANSLVGDPPDPYFLLFAAGKWSLWDLGGREGRPIPIWPNWPPLALSLSLSRSHLLTLSRALFFSLFHPISHIPLHPRWSLISRLSDINNIHSTYIGLCTP